MALPPIVPETWHLVRAATGEVGVANAHAQLLATGGAGPRAAFRDACTKPLVGKPRRPKQLAVADEGAAAEVRGAMPGVAVVVAPEGEVERALHARIFYARAEGPTWGYPTPTFLGLLALGELLLEAAPWQVLGPGDRLALLDPEQPADPERVVVVRGALGASERGFDVFASRADADRDGAPRLRLALRDPATLTPAMREAAGSRNFLSRVLPIPLVMGSDARSSLAPAPEARALVRVSKSLCALIGARRADLADGRPTAVSHEGVELRFDGR